MIKPKNRRNGMYFRDGKVYVSVTEILSVIAKPALISWAAKEAARAALANPELTEQEAASSIYGVRNAAVDRGSSIHSFAEAVLKGADIDLETAPEAYRGYCEAFLSWIKSSGMKALSSEVELRSDKHGFAGTCDMIAKDANGDTWLIDFKTGKEIYKEAELQVEAYRQASKEAGVEITKTGVLLLAEDGAFKFAEVHGSFPAFLACLELYKFFNADKLNKMLNPPKAKEKAVSK